jgi:dipeptidyl aminopeptidase/acylaminoacyl peptidase
LTDQYNQIYIIQTQEGLSKEQTKARRVTDINADHNAPQWTPDGKYLITARMDDPKRDEPWRWSSIFRIRIEDLKTEQLTDASYSSFGPISSPDGQWIAFGRYPRERLSERITRLAVMPSIGGTITDLNLVLNRNMIEFKWKADGKGLLFTATDRGVIGLYQVDIETTKSSLVIAGNLHIESFDCHPEGDIAFSASSPTNPSELFWKPSSESAPVQKTFTNEKFLETRHIQDTHELNWETKGGVQVQGWYILPVGYEREKQYPLALNIHGGPHIMWGPATKSMWHEWQFQAAQGYVVFFCNPQGADGYGENFQMALHANWGNLAMDDIMAGVERLIEKGFVDTNRLAVTGGSYGGYMTAWIASHSDRFAAAVAQRGVYNLLGFIGNTDITSFIPTEFGVEPWDDPMMLWNNSPLSHAHKIKTPILLIHSENDFRVPISEAEQMFTYIRRSGGTVKLIRFPREGHELTRTGEPEHRVSNLLHVIDWFNQFCQPRSQNSKGHPVP